MQRETTNQDFPVNFRGIALTGQHRSIAMTQVMQKKRKICTQKSQNLNILHQILSSQYVTKKITLIVLLSHLFASQAGLAMITLPPFVNCFLSLCQGRPYLLSLSPPSPTPKTSPPSPSKSLPSALLLSSPLSVSSWSSWLWFSLVASLLVLSLGSLQLPVSRRFHFTNDVQTNDFKGCSFWYYQ